MRIRVVFLVSLAGVNVILVGLLALAVNAATAVDRWPGPLDWLRQYPWLATAALGALSVIVTIAALLYERLPASHTDPPTPPLDGVPDGFVARDQVRDAVEAVCRGAREVRITTSLYGAGGFGKTTVAKAVCADERVQRHFRSRVYFVTIGRDVRGRAAVASKVAEVTRYVTGDTKEFSDPEMAGAHLGRLLDQRLRTLMVLDDVWDDEQLAPFLQGGDRCVRLVTTRKPDLLPNNPHAIQVDEMSRQQAFSLLTWQLPSLPDTVVASLLQVTGRCPLLLRLTNRQIATQISTGAEPVAAAEETLKRLREHGAAAVDPLNPSTDLDDPRVRNKSATASIEAATTLLPAGGADRFSELGIFAEDQFIPVSIVAMLWHATGGLTGDRTRELCRALAGLSLISLDPEDGGRISLHDVFRDHVRRSLGATGISHINGHLIDAVAASLPRAQPLRTAAPDPRCAWWRAGHGYLLDHLIGHFLDAGRTTDAEAVAGDLRWVETRVVQRGPSAPRNDLARIDTPHARSLARSLAQAAHLLAPTQPEHSLTAVLHSRLDAHPHWHHQISARQSDPALRPCLTNLWPLPDAPSPALQLTLTGHTTGVVSVVISPDGTWLATRDDNGTVRLWDRATGDCTAILTSGSAYGSSMVISPDGKRLVIGDRDGTVRLWDLQTQTCTATLDSGSGPVESMAVSADCTRAATSDRDGTVRLWDLRTQTCTAALTGLSGAVRTVAISPDGIRLATAESEGTVRLWDLRTQTCTATLSGHAYAVLWMAFIPDGTQLATCDSDGAVRLWNLHTETCTATLTGHDGSASPMAISPDGTCIAAGGLDGMTVRVWNLESHACTAVLTGHASLVVSITFSPDGTCIAAGAIDGTVRLWDWNVATNTASAGITTGVRSVAISHDGSCLATRDYDGTVRLWDRATAKCIGTLPNDIGPVEVRAISPDSTLLAIGGYDGTVHLWDRVAETFTGALGWHAGLPLAVAISPDGTRLAAGDRDGIVRLWDLELQTCSAKLACGSGPIGLMAITPDCTRLATVDDDGFVRLWNGLESATCIAALPEHGNFLTSIAISPEGTQIATVNRVGTIRVWDVLELRVTAIGRADGLLTSCAWSSDGRELAVGGARGLYLFGYLADGGAVDVA